MIYPAATRYNKLAQWGLWAVVIALALRLVLFLPEAATRPSHGFSALYTLAQLVREGADLGLSYQDDWFKAQMARFLPPDIGDVNINPPPYALLGLPLTGFDYTGARIIWTGVSVLCLIVGVAWLTWRVDLRGPWALGFVAYVLVSQPVRENLRLGQVYLFLFMLSVLAWDAYRQNKQRDLGLILGLMGSVKLAGLFIWPLLLIQRRWRAVVWGGMTVVVICLASLALTSPAAWLDYPSYFLRFNTHPSLAVTAYQTQLSLIWHLFTFDAEWNPAPVLSSPFLATWLPRLSGLVLLGIPAYLAYQHSRQDAHRRGNNSDSFDFIIAAVIIANLVLSTAALDYHYPLLLLPAAILIAWARQRPSVWVWGILSLALWLIAADLPYRSPWFYTAGLWSLLAYPKLYGAWLLWGLCIYGCFTRETYV